MGWDWARPWLKISAHRVEVYSHTQRYQIKKEINRLRERERDEGRQVAASSCEES